MLPSVSCFFFRGEGDAIVYPPHLSGHYLPVLFSPSCRRTAFLFFEHTIKVGAGRKTAFGGNDVVAEVGVFQNHLLAASNRTSASQMRKVESKEKERYRDNSVLGMSSERDRVTMFNEESL